MTEEIEMAEPTGPMDWDVYTADQPLVDCPACAFTFSAEHTSVNGGYTCPVCREAVLIKQVAALVKVLDVRLNSSAYHSVETQIDAVKHCLDVFEPEWRSIGG